MQTDLLNDPGFSTTVVIPCTTVTCRDAQGDGFPIKVNIGHIQKPGCSPQDTDAFVAGLKAISNHRFKGDSAIATPARSQIKRIEDAIKLILDLK